MGKIYALVVLYLMSAFGVGAQEPQPIGAEFQVNSFTLDSQESAAVATAPDGGSVVVWESVYQDGFWLGIFGQRYDSSGSKLGEEFQVNSFTIDSQRSPAVATDANDDFVVVWESAGSSGTDSSGGSVQGQRYAADGSPVGGEIQVNTYTTSNQGQPAIDSGGSGQFLVVWESYGQDGSYFGAFGQRFHTAEASPIFVDGFETGDTGGWSGTVPE